MFHKIICFIKHFFRRLVWEIQVRNLPVEFIEIKRRAKTFSANGKVLVIAPHADDELIGCHQIICNHAINTTIFYCSFLGTNPSDENRRVREREIKRYAGTLHCSLFLSSPEHILEDLRGLINDNHPSVICLPSVVDWHSEHRQVNYILSEVLSTSKWQGQIIWYHVTLPIPAQYVNCYSEMNRKQHTLKWNMMKTCYRSQLQMDIKRFQFIERIIKNDNYATETYINMSYLEWTDSLELILSKDYCFDSFKQSLGDINKMFSETADYYKFLQT